MNFYGCNLPLIYKVKIHWYLDCITLLLFVPVFYPIIPVILYFLTMLLLVVCLGKYIANIELFKGTTS